MLPLTAVREPVDSSRNALIPAFAPCKMRLPCAREKSSPMPSGPPLPIWTVMPRLTRSASASGNETRSWLSRFKLCKRRRRRTIEPDFKIQLGHPKARPNEGEFLLSGSLAPTQDGVVYLNPNKTWKLRGGVGHDSFELVPVMTHEIGHLFEFSHSEDERSITDLRYRPGGRQ